METIGTVVCGVVLLVILYYFKPGWFGANGGNTANPKMMQGSPQINQFRVSQAQYQQIQHGMSYSQVANIIGWAGEELANVRTDILPGVTPSVDTRMYSWNNGDGSSMNAMFQNDRLISKGQFGLE